MAAIIIPATKITRPANVTAYVVGRGLSPVVSALREIPLATLAASGFSTLFGIRCTSDQATCQLSLRYHFWSSNAVTAIADGAVFPLDLTFEASYLSYVDCNAFATADASSTMSVAQISDLSFLLRGDASKSVWYQTEVRNGVSVAPKSSGTFWDSFMLIQ